jgi:hypothetical protein
VDSIIQIFPLFEIMILNFQFEKTVFTKRNLLVHVLAEFSCKSSISLEMHVFRNRANNLRERVEKTYFSSDSNSN